MFGLMILILATIVHLIQGEHMMTKFCNIFNMNRTFIAASATTKYGRHSMGTTIDNGVLEKTNKMERFFGKTEINNIKFIEKTKKSQKVGATTIENEKVPDKEQYLITGTYLKVIIRLINITIILCTFYYQHRMMIIKDSIGKILNRLKMSNLLLKSTMSMKIMGLDRLLL